MGRPARLKKRRHVNFYMEQDLYEAVVVAAAIKSVENREIFSFSDFIREAIAEAIKREKQ